MTGHRTHVYEARYRFQPRCECGWKGRWRPLRQEAWDEMQMHKLEKRHGG